MEKKTKGLFLKNVVEIVAEQKGKPGLEELEKELGNIHFSALQDYPTEVEIKLQKAVIKVLYGQYLPQYYEKLTKLNLQKYASSIIGKTIFSLLKGKNLKEIAMESGKFIATITTGQQIKIQCLEGNSLKFILIDCPYPIEYYKGLLKASLEYFQKQGTVTEQAISANNYEYLVTWKE